MNKMYSEALCEYFQAYRYWPAEPLLLLSIAVAYVNLATTRKVTDRNRAVLTGLAFMQVPILFRGIRVRIYRMYYWSGDEGIFGESFRFSDVQQDALLLVL